MVIVFDLNGTLLDSRAVQPELRCIFGRKLDAEEYFTRILQYSMALSLVGEYRAFSDIALAVLRMEGEARKVKLTEVATKRVWEALRNLPPFRDVPGSLRRLQKAGFRLAVLTNSAYDDARVQVANAHLIDCFEHVFSVAEVRRFKPSPETYDLAAKKLGVQPHQMLMVAAHPWDLVGAATAGCRTAFIQRPGKALLPGAPRPTYVASDVAALAVQLLKAGGTHRASRLVPAIAAAGALSTFALTAAVMRRAP